MIYRSHWVIFPEWATFLNCQTTIVRMCVYVCVQKTKPLFRNGLDETSCGEFDKKPFLIRFPNRRVYPLFVLFSLFVYIAAATVYNKEWVKKKKMVNFLSSSPSNIFYPHSSLLYIAKKAAELVPKMPINFAKAWFYCSLTIIFVI